MQTLNAEEARAMILSGKFPAQKVVVNGEIDLSNEKNLTHIPDGLHEIWGLNLSGCTALEKLPDNLNVHRLILDDCTSLTHLPSGLKAYSLQAQNTGLIALPDDIEVNYKLDLTGCQNLEYLPPNLHVGSLVLSGCTKLQALPDDLHLYFLDATNCVNFKEWGQNGSVEVGMINLSGCQALTYLPSWLTPIADLNVQNCTNLASLPAGLKVTSTIELADSGLSSLPSRCKETKIRWNDVLVNEQVAFRPEMITAKTVLNEKNIELRRVMLDRIGYETFFEQAKAEELDRDADPGGMRRLLRVEFEDENRWRRDEALVCLSVICPSTARKYVIRVPPDTKTCRQAAAWVAGFDSPDEYNPVIET